MTDKNSIVVVYEAHSAAEEGVKELQRAGFDVKRLSIIGREYHTEEHVVAYYNAGDRMGLIGAVFYVIPGIGPVLIAGPLALSIVEALKRVDLEGSMSALGIGLYNVGVPEESIVRYEAALRAGKLLLIAYGSPEELMKARDTLHGTHPEELNIHFVDDKVLAPA